MKTIATHKAKPATPNPPVVIQGRIGEHLAQARQAQGISDVTVANKLHLSVAVIQALEQDQYDKMPSTVFVRGYIKKYAQLLGLDEQTLPPLPTAEPVHQFVPPSVSKRRVDHEIRSNHALVQMATWGIVLGLITLVALWWQGQLDWENKSTEVVSSTPVTEQSTSATTDIVQEPMVRKPVLPATMSQPPVNRTVTPPLTPQPIPTPKSPVQTSPAIVPLSKPTVAATEHKVMGDAGAGEAAAANTNPIPSQSEAKPVEAPKTELPKIVLPHQIVLEFFGASWVDVRDSKHTFRLHGKMHKGDKRTLDGGVPPYTMVLGNSAAVKLKVDGRPVDIISHAHNGIARFKFDPSAPSH